MEWGKTLDGFSQTAREAGFSEIRISLKDESREFIRDWVPGSGVEANVVSAHIKAIKACAGD